MTAAEKYDVIVLGGGTAGKVIAWTMAKQSMRTAVIDRKYVGGSCPNVACLPSKNVIHSAKVASLVARHAEFGIKTGPFAIDMAPESTTVSARWWKGSSRFIWASIKRRGLNSFGATARSWLRVPFMSVSAMEASVCSPLTVYSWTWELTQPCLTHRGSGRPSR